MMEKTMPLPSATGRSNAALDRITDAVSKLPHHDAPVPRKEAMLATAGELRDIVGRELEYYQRDFAEMLSDASLARAERDKARMEAHYHKADADRWKLDVHELQAKLDEARRTIDKLLDALAK